MLRNEPKDAVCDATGGDSSTTADNIKKEIQMYLFSEPDWIRTNDLLLRRQLLYPAELPVRSERAAI